MRKGLLIEPGREKLIIIMPQVAKSSCGLKRPLCGPNASLTKDVRSDSLDGSELGPLDVDTERLAQERKREREISGG